MNTSPITTWEGATAYFTFADKPGITMFLVAAAAVVCIGAIASMISHENDSYRKINGHH